MSYKDAIQTRLDTAWLPSNNPHAMGLGGYLSAGWTFRELRDRARNLVLNNTLARLALDRSVENVIGRQIDLKPASGDEAFDTAADREWKRFIRGTNADIHRRLSWGGLCRRVYRLKKRDGDVGVVLVDVNGFPALQVIEANLIATPTDGRGQRTIIDGIELDDRGRMAAAWVRKRDGFTRVEGRDFLFLENEADKEGIIRGESSFNGTFFLFDQVAGTADAIVVAMRVAASQAMVASRERESDPLPDDPTEEQVRNERDYETPAEHELAAGTVHYENGPWKYSQFKPEHPSQNAVEYMTWCIRQVASRFGVSVSQILFDFTGLNYSVSRAESISINRIASVERDDLIEPFAGRVYRWVIAKAIKRGQAGDFVTGITVDPPERWDRCEYIPDDRPIVDLEHHMKAVKDGVALGIMSRTREAMKLGTTVEQVVEDQRRENALMAAAGLSTSSDTTESDDAAE